ncbi:MAG: heme-binding beta-barrel domain-containing protein [Myxococcota bacterium]|nr:heme-binding beta-barrel domain-containing protein [Myxococcota bacterium]
MPRSEKGASVANELGPLAGLEGTWEGDKGTDTSPDDDRVSEEINQYRERMTFEATGLVENHDQRLYGLRYGTTAWRLGEPDPFHEERGYWLWDGDAKQVLRCFIVPRGVSVIAGGSAEAHASSFKLAAELGSHTFGICSNPFLDREFRTLRYELEFEKRGADTIHYWEDTVLQIKGQDELFHHTDENTLTRVG